VLPFIIVGLVTGSLYGLAGVGLVLTYRASGVFNFAQGAVAAAAAFLFHSLHDTHGLPWPVAATITVLVFAFVGGLALERISLPLLGAPPVAVVVATIGLFLAIEGFLLVKFGAVTRTEPDFLPTSGFQLSDVHITWAQVISASVAFVGALGLYVFMRTSKLGVSMRAVVDNASLVALAGEKPASIRRAAWTIGSGFAAISGILLAPPLGLDAQLLTLLVVQAFGACAIGLFKSLPLTFAGGLIVGVTASLSTKYFTIPPWSGLHDAVPFLVLIAVLLVVPLRTLPGARVSLRSLTPDPLGIPRRVRLALATGFAVLLLSVPSWAGSRLPVWISAANLAVVFLSLALLQWTSGQLSLCHLAFAAIGATTVSHLTDGGVPWLPAVLLAGLITLPVGALVAIPAIRLSGIYLALLTLGFGLLMEYVVYPSSLMFGQGLVRQTPRPRLGFIHGDRDTTMYFIALAFAVVTAVVVLSLQRSRLGRILRALGESPTMLQTLGIGVTATRLIVFSASAFLASIGGGLMITQSGTVAATGFNPVESLLLVAILAICGTRPLTSSLAAAGLLALLPSYLDDLGISDFGQEKQLLTFGLAAVAAGLFIGARPRITARLDTWSARSDGRAAHSPVRSRDLVAVVGGGDA
jgi:branched-subunit amino acid ABC-type transport system permease component